MKHLMVQMTHINLMNLLKKLKNLKIINLKQELIKIILNI